MKRFIIESYESISENSEKRIVGGFTASFSMEQIDHTKDDNANNCLGGNCKPGCAAHQNIDCNKVAGCSN